MGTESYWRKTAAWATLMKTDPEGFEWAKNWLLMYIDESYRGTNALDNLSRCDRLSMRIHTEKENKND